MKLLTGITLFLLCALIGEEKNRRIRRRERTLANLYDLIRQIGDRQLNGMVPFREGVTACPPSPERELLLDLADGNPAKAPLLTAEERTGLAAYARSESRSVRALRAERDELLSMLRQARDKTEEEMARKGQIYRSVGYLSGAGILLLLL